MSGVGDAVARAGAAYLAQAAGTSIAHVEVYVDDVADAERVRAVDLNTGTRDLLAPVLQRLHLVADPARAPPAGMQTRPTGSARSRARPGFFGRALLDGRRGHRLDARRRRPAGAARPPPAGRPAVADAYVLTCSYFYDEEYLRGFQFLLQELEASLKHRRVAALEAFGLRRKGQADPFRGYIRELNLFHPEVLEGSGFRQVQVKGEVARYRLDLATLVASARRSVAWERGRGGGRGAAGLTGRGAPCDGRGRASGTAAAGAASSPPAAPRRARRRA